MKKQPLMILLTALTFLLSCKKEADTCQTWSTETICEAKTASVQCNNPEKKSTQVCGSETNKVFAGYKEVIFESNEKKIYILYLNRTQ